MPVLYLDESGEEGFKNTSSEWFILGGALHRNGYAPTVRSHYALFRDRHHAKAKDWYFHFQTASHATRRGFIKHMIELDYTLVSVVIHKRSLRFTENFQKKYFLYFYATRLLLEAATAWAHENQPGPLRVQFSTRRGLSVERFCEYLEIVRTSRHVTRDYVKWQYIDHRHFHASPNRQLVGLQMADCYASAIGQALELNDHDMTDCCYVRQLQPKIMARNGTCKGYGVKIWPPPGRAIMTQPRLDWYHLI